MLGANLGLPLYGEVSLMFQFILRIFIVLFTDGKVELKPWPFVGICSSAGIVVFIARVSRFVENFRKL